MKSIIRCISLVLTLVLMVGSVVFSVSGTDNPEDTLEFTDVESQSWYYNSVKYVFENKIMQGVSYTLFSPNGRLTRAMAVTILFRLSGEPSENNDNTFIDVEKGKWYSKPISWAQSEGIVNGKTPEVFDPDGEILRAEFATMLYRYLSSSKMVLSEIRDGEPIDIDSVPKYAKESVRKMYRSGIINGRSNGEFDSAAPITRSETAAMVERYDKNTAPKLTINGVWKDNAVTMGWVLNELYELDDKPDVQDWSPYEDYVQIGIYLPDDPGWVKTQDEIEFWNNTVKQKWYYKSLLWARANDLYSCFVQWNGRWDSEWIERDFEESVICMDELADIIVNYCDKINLQLPKVRDYPGFADVDEADSACQNLIILYQSGVIPEVKGDQFGFNRAVIYDEAIMIINGLNAIKNQD